MQNFKFLFEKSLPIVDMSFHGYRIPTVNKRLGTANTNKVSRKDY